MDKDKNDVRKRKSSFKPNMNTLGHGMKGYLVDFDVRIDNHIKNFEFVVNANNPTHAINILESELFVDLKKIELIE